MIRGLIKFFGKIGRPSAARNGAGQACPKGIREETAEPQMQLKHEDRGSTVALYSKTYARTSVGTILQSDDAGLFAVGRTIRVGGWVRTGRVAGRGAWIFLKINDGSCCQELQAVVTKQVADAVGGYGALESAGTSVLLEGELVRSPENKKQKVELRVSRVLHLGPCDSSAGKYSLPKTHISPESLRGYMHLRPRTDLMGAIFRIRNELAIATHGFFQSHGFLYIHTPIITSSDCEGAGEQFQVTTLLSKAGRMEEEPALTEAEMRALEEEVIAQKFTVDESRARAAQEGADKALKTAAKAEAKKLKKLEDTLGAHQLKAQARTVGGIERLEDGRVDYAKDFFGKPAYLTVSGQMQVEYCACALSNVYSFGPTFRAKNSHTARHLAEFWMVEPEMAFADLEDDMRCAEDYVRHCCRHVLDRCMLNLELIIKRDRADSGAIARLQHIADSPFARCKYTDAIDILKDHVKSKRAKFSIQVEWGIDLGSEHERYLTEKVFKKPVIVYDYPKDIKAFYMRANDDGKTVAAMDVLVPKVGELIGGSQREERPEVLEARLRELGMPLEPYSGYQDLRCYGSVPHSGFGLGFERLMLLVTGVDNIREVIPFPRWPGHADF